MARNLSTEDVLKEYQSAFPEGLGSLFYSLYNEVSILHFDWKNYRALYGTSPERIDLLNLSASSFFERLEQILRHNVIMTIVRLTDKAKIGKRENASLRKFLELIKPHIDLSFLEELEVILSELEISSNKARSLRNKILAHSDFLRMLSYNSEPIEGMSRAEIEEILSLVRSFMNKVELYFRKSQTGYQHIIAQNDAEALIWVLEQAQKHTEE